MLLEGVSSLVTDNSSKIALAEPQLKELDVERQFDWEEPFHREANVGFPPKAVHVPTFRSEEEEDEYFASEAHLVHTKRRLLNGLLHRRRERDRLREDIKRVDALRASLNLEPIFRHPNDWTEESHAHG